ncbi:MAG: DUF3307 domain-containing protein [Candidatus Rokuibacteriota bacterium]
MLLFFQLYLAHLVADFLLQPDWIARRKTELEAHPPAPREQRLVPRS